MESFKFVDGDCLQRVHVSIMSQLLEGGNVLRLSAVPVQGWVVFLSGSALLLLFLFLFLFPRAAKRDSTWKVLHPVSWTDDLRQVRPLVAGSALAQTEGTLWAVADDLNHLLRLSPSGEPAESFVLFPEELPEDPALRKKVKRDFEALFEIPTRSGKRLIAFPSGSKDNRMWGSLIHLDGAGDFVSATEVDFSPLLQALKTQIEDLNIEGGAVLGNQLLLFQRGNGPAKFNGIVRINLADFEQGLTGRWDVAAQRFGVRAVSLGDYDGTPLSFTEADVIDGQIFFAAAAERSKDTYEDGPVTGSVIGRLTPNFEAEILLKIPDLKVEGLCLKEAGSDWISLYGLTDADDPGKTSALLQIDIAASAGVYSRMEDQSLRHINRQESDTKSQGRTYSKINHRREGASLFQELNDLQ